MENHKENQYKIRGIIIEVHLWNVPGRKHGKCLGHGKGWDYERGGLSVWAQGPFANVNMLGRICFYDKLTIWGSWYDDIIFSEDNYPHEHKVLASRHFKIIIFITESNISVLYNFKKIAHILWRMGSAVTTAAKLWQASLAMNRKN